LIEVEEGVSPDHQDHRVLELDLVDLELRVGGLLGSLVDLDDSHPLLLTLSISARTGRGRGQRPHLQSFTRRARPTTSPEAGPHPTVAACPRRRPTTPVPPAAGGRPSGPAGVRTAGPGARSKRW